MHVSLKYVSLCGNIHVRLGHVSQQFFKHDNIYLKKYSYDFMKLLEIIRGPTKYVRDLIPCKKSLFHKVFITFIFICIFQKKWFVLFYHGPLFLMWLSFPFCFLKLMK